MKVSFSGVYDIHFPAGTKLKDIEKKENELNKILKNNSSLKNNIDVLPIYEKDDHYRPQKKGFRLVTNVDGSFILYRLFATLNLGLAEDYINKTKVDLMIDTKA